MTTAFHHGVEIVEIDDGLRPIQTARSSVIGIVGTAPAAADAARGGVTVGIQQRIINVMIALDQLAWVLLTLGKGHPDETISAALWRMEQQGKTAGRIFRPLVDLLFRPIEMDHCYQAWLSEVQRSQLPSAYKG